MFKRIVTLVLLSLLLVSTFPFTFDLQKGRASSPEPFSDEFNSSVLDSRWIFVDPDGGSYVNLSANAGWLRMETVSPPGRDLYAGVQNAPHLMQSGISGNFTVEIKVTAVMIDNDEGAGLLVWRDSHTHLRFERISRTIGQPTQQEIILLVEGVGSGGGLVVLSSDINPTYLRLVKSGESYSGYYSSDGISRQHVADATFPVGDPVDVGLDIIHMYHDGAFLADFDYFRIYTPEHSWWNRDWQHRVEVTITENSGHNLTDFPVEVTFEHSGYMKTDGTDVRIIDDLAEIPSYVETYNSTHATATFETDLTASESKTVYIYYGNPSSSPPAYPLVSLDILEGNTGNAMIDNRVYIGWDYTSWGWSNPVELWNDFRIDFNRNGNPLDDGDLIIDYGSRQGGIGRFRGDLQAIGLGDYMNYSQTPIYADINFAYATLRVYKNHPW